MPENVDNDDEDLIDLHEDFPVHLGLMVKDIFNRFVECGVHLDSFIVWTAIAEVVRNEVITECSTRARAKAILYSDKGAGALVKQNLKDLADSMDRQKKKVDLPKRTKVCLRCHNGGYTQSKSNHPDGRPKFKCTKCDFEWTCGIDGGDYAVKS